MQEVYETIRKMEIPDGYQAFGQFKRVVLFNFSYIYDSVISQYKEYLFKERKTDVVDLFKEKVNESILELSKKLECSDLEEKTISSFRYKIDCKNELLNYKSEKEVFECCKKDFSWFLDVFSKYNSDKSKEILSNIIYLFCMEIEYDSYFSKFSRENTLNNHCFDNIVSIYQEKGINILLEDSEFRKYKINSVSENIKIICNQANRYLVDERLDINFCINIPRFLLETLSNFYDHGLIHNLSFRIDGLRKSFLIFDSFDHGAKLNNDIETLPSLSRLFDLDNYENALWIKHDKVKKHLTFEETSKNFELLNDDVVTQLVHLEYFIENDIYFISHVDHEYIIYSLDEYAERLTNSNIKGYKKVKTFKVDNSRIPFFEKYKNEYFLFIVLSSYFNHTDLLKEYFEKIS